MSKKVRRENKVLIDGELLQMVTCPVCLEVFKKPVMLARCGHSICKACADHILKSSLDCDVLTCPVCRCQNPVGGPDQSRFPLNFAASSVAGLLKDRSRSQVLGDDCPHADVFTKLVTVCPHCEKKFCSACCVAHIENLKMKANWIVSDFKPRYGETHACLSGKGEKMESIICDLVSKTKAAIESESEKLIEMLKEVVMRRKEELITEANNFGEKQLKQCRHIRDASIPKGEFFEGIADKLKHLNNMSPLYCDMDELAKLYSEFRVADSYLQEYDRYGRGVPLGKMKLGLFDEWAPMFKETFSNILKSQFRLDTYTMEPWDKKPISEFARLKKAAEEGDLEYVKAALERPRLPPSCVRFILQRSDLFNFRGGLLPCAVESGCLPLVRYLIEEKKADLSIIEHYWSTIGPWRNGGPVSDEKNENQLAVWRYLLETEPSLLKLTTTHGSLLHVAARKGLSSVVSFLILEKGMDVNITNVHGDNMTPIWDSALHPKIVELLIGLGANLHLKTRTFDTLLHNFADGGNVESFLVVLRAAPDLIVKMDDQSRINMANLAAHSNSQRMVETVFSLMEVELSTLTDPKECMSLVLAVIKDVPDPVPVLQQLAKLGVMTHASASNDVHSSPLHWAVMWISSPDIFRGVVRFLLDRDPAILSRVNSDGKTAIDLVYELGDMDKLSFGQFLISCAGPENISSL